MGTSDRSSADRLADLARELAGKKGADAVVQRVIEASVSQIEGAEHASVTVLDKRSATTPAASDDFVCEIDKHQYATGEGPCLTAAVEKQPVVRVNDLLTDARWPAFSAAVAPFGLHSMLCFHLYTDADAVGALNVYAKRVGAFSEESVHTGTLLAAHAAVAIAAAKKSANLQVALESRDTIGQAKGILMERYKIGPAAAFDLLIAASQRTHRKLREVADQLTATGELSMD
jgi:transcriptional regulator with GAF, ATPase, and Fis domain